MSPVISLTVMIEMGQKSWMKSYIHLKSNVAANIA
jgi:hypothetical protein